MCALHRRAPRRDANEKAIFEAFKAAGCSILPLSMAGGPDAVITHPSRGYWLVEIKTKGGRLTVRQQQFREAWTGPAIHTVRSVDEALALTYKPQAKT